MILSYFLLSAVTSYPPDTSLVDRAAKLYCSASASEHSFDPSTFRLFLPSTTTPIQLYSAQKLEQKKQGLFAESIGIINELFSRESLRIKLIISEEKFRRNDILRIKRQDEESESKRQERIQELVNVYANLIDGINPQEEWDRENVESDEEFTRNDILERKRQLEPEQKETITNCGQYKLERQKRNQRKEIDNGEKLIRNGILKEEQKERQEISNAYVNPIEDLDLQESAQREYIESEKEYEYDCLKYLSILHYLYQQDLLEKKRPKTGNISPNPIDEQNPIEHGLLNLKEPKELFYWREEFFFSKKIQIFDQKVTDLQGSTPERRHIEKDGTLYECSSIDPKDLVRGQTSISFLELSNNCENFKKIRNAVDNYFNQHISWKNRILYTTLVRFLLSRGEKKVQLKGIDIEHARYTHIDNQGSVTVFAPEAERTPSWKERLGEKLFPGLMAELEKCRIKIEDAYSGYENCNVEYRGDQVKNKHDCVKFSTVYMLYDILGISPETISSVQVYLGFKFLESQCTPTPKSFFAQYVSCLWRKPADWFLQWMLPQEQKDFLKDHLTQQHR